MDAIIFAAGLGTRLADITMNMPKALVDVGGMTMLERTARALIDAGTDRLIINVHHFADMIVEHVRERDNFGVEVELSLELEDPLETGGALLHARDLFRRDAPFIAHNVDIITDIDIPAMYDAHTESDALATLATHERSTSRYLLFDDEGLAGRTDGDTTISARPPEGEITRRAFAGIHVISPEFLDLISETGKFSILQPYLRLAAGGHRIRPFDVTGNLWIEVGTPARLEEARRRFSA